MNNEQKYTVSVLFYRGRSLISRLIRKFDGRYSHCCILLADSKILESDIFTHSRIKFNPYNPERCDYITFELTGEQSNELNRLAIRYCDYRYDYKRIIGYVIMKLFKFNKPQFLDSKYNFLCSELVEMVLGGIGIIPIDNNFNNRTPSELYTYLLSIKNKNKNI